MSAGARPSCRARSLRVILADLTDALRVGCVAIQREKMRARLLVKDDAGGLEADRSRAVANEE
jgi:hypothetical protein